MKKTFILFTVLTLFFFNIEYAKYFIINTTIVKGKLLSANELQCQIEIDGKVKKFPTNLISNIGNDIKDLFKKGIVLNNDIQIYGNYSIAEVKNDVITFKSQNSTLTINAEELISYSKTQNNENLIYIKNSIINYNKLDFNLKEGIISTNFGKISINLNNLTNFDTGKYLISAEGLFLFLNTLKKESNVYISNKLTFPFEKIYSINDLKENKTIYKNTNPYLVFKLPYDLKIKDIIHSENTLYILGEEKLYVYDRYGVIKKTITVKSTPLVKIIDSHLIIFSNELISFYNRKTLKLEQRLTLNNKKYSNKIITPLTKDTYLIGGMLNYQFLIYNLKTNKVNPLNLYYTPYKIINTKDEKIFLEINSISFLDNNLNELKTIDIEPSFKNDIILKNNNLYFFHEKIDCYNKGKLLYSFDPMMKYENKFFDDKENLYLISNNTIKNFAIDNELWEKTFEEPIVYAFSKPQGVYVLFKDRYIVLNNKGKVIKVKKLKYSINKFYFIMNDFIVYEQNNSLIFVNIN